MAKRDYYEILGINRDADEAAIKKAYRRLAMEYHPDRNPGDRQAVEKMKEINEAYAVLSDGHKRRLYDTYGHAGLEGYTMDDILRGVDFASIFREFGLGDFGFDFGRGFGESIFDRFFGRRETTRTREPRRGLDLRYDLDVSLEDVVAGAEKVIELPKRETCARCQGMGAEADGLAQCEQCQGSGQIVLEQRTGSSIFRQITICSGCRGQGRIIKEPCQECQGKGFLEKIKEIPVLIPSGADTGYRIRIEGEGEEGEGIPGDLWVIINVQKHPIFERHGDDIYLEKEVSFVQAALGGEVKAIPGLEGELTLEIPEGTQPGAIFRIMDKGIPHLNDYGRGDQYVMIKVATPTDLSDEEKELLREFDRLRRRRSNP